jgi:hypothetical protein
MDQNKGLGPTPIPLEVVLQHLSERGRLEWELAVQRAVNAQLMEDLGRAQSDAPGSTPPE